MRVNRRASALIAAVTLCAASNDATAARVALVIGNDAYAHVTPLSNAGNDARLMASALAAL